MDRMFVLFVVGEMEAFEPGAKKEVYLFPKKHDISWNWLVVSIQLKNLSQNGFIFPRDRGENKKCLKPPTRTSNNTSNHPLKPPLHWDLHSAGSNTPQSWISHDQDIQDILLVGGWTNPSEKYARHMGNLPQKMVKPPPSLVTENHVKSLISPNASCLNFSYEELKVYLLVRIAWQI